VSAIAVLAAVALLPGCASIPADQAENELRGKGGYALQRSPHALEGGRTSPQTPHTDDLWLRLRGSFRIVDVHHSAVDREIDRWSRWPRTISDASARATPFLYHVVDEINRRGLPGEFALVPFVETGFRLTARSPRGASGLWQFMPATGRRFGLQSSWWYDGRRDFLASTRAAVDYLAYLYRRFNEDALLTLAAYNAGEGRVDAARTRNRNVGSGVDYWSLALPAETRVYVPRVLALARVLEDPSRYGIALSPVANRPVLTTVDTGGQIEFAVVAELAQLPTEQLRELNPGHLRWATAPDGPHVLVLPEQKAKDLEVALSKLPASERVRWTNHRVVAGDTLWELSRSYGISTSLLKQSNGLLGDRIRLGQNLLVPLEPAGGASPALAVQSQFVYVVRPGDNLWKIARQFGVSHRAIARWNDRHPREILRPGEKLLIRT
jgi:membrane-bound lytic murein transglycosylase D